IEDYNRAGAVADESPCEFGNQSNAVVVFLAGNVGNCFTRIRVDDHCVCAARDVETVTLCINRDVVEAALPANVKRLFDSPFALSESACAKSDRSCHDQ